MNKKLIEMTRLLTTCNLSYNEPMKDRFKINSKAFLKDLGKALKLKEMKVWFNPGGIAVSGDAVLMGMWTEDKGIYVSIDQTGITPPILYRIICNMKDYRGKRNNFIPVEHMEDFEYIVEQINKLKDRY